MLFRLLEIVFVKYLFHISVNWMEMERYQAYELLELLEGYIELNFSILKNDIK